MLSLQSIIWVFLLNNFSHVINLLLTKLARDRTGRISALGLFCTDLAALGPYCQDLGPIFSQYGPRAWLIRYMYSTGKHYITTGGTGVYIYVYICIYYLRLDVYVLDQNEIQVKMKF